MVEATSIPICAAATALLLSGCGVRSILGDRVKWIVVQNDTGATFNAADTDYADGPANGGTTIEAGKEGEVGWTDCKTAWLVVRASSRIESEEHGRFELELCPGDHVIIHSDYDVTVEEQK